MYCIPINIYYQRTMTESLRGWSSFLWTHIDRNRQSSCLCHCKLSYPDSSPFSVIAKLSLFTVQSLCSVSSWVLFLGCYQNDSEILQIWMTSAEHSWEPSGSFPDPIWTTSRTHNAAPWPVHFLLHNSFLFTKLVEIFVRTVYMKHHPLKPRA